MLITAKQVKFSHSQKNLNCTVKVPYVVRYNKHVKTKPTHTKQFLQTQAQMKRKNEHRVTGTHESRK